MSWLVRHCLASIALSAAASLTTFAHANTQSHAEFKAAYADANALEQTAPDAAFEAMRKLADAGFSKAQDRLGFYYRFGIGRDVDLQEAQSWYRRAVDGGRAFSLAPLARVEVSLGNEEAALELLQEAARLDMPGAARQLALNHIDRKFGNLSDPTNGLQLLEAMIREQDAKAAVSLLLRYNWRRLRDPAPDSVVQFVEKLGLAGDPKAAEAALWYLTRVEPHQVERRAALFAVPNQRPERHLSEEIALAADRNPTKFWIEAERILSNADPRAFAKAAITTYRINKNAFYRVLQIELARLGYQTGRPDGLLGPATIKAMNKFCRDHQIWAACSHGPARVVSIKAIAEQLVDIKGKHAE